MTDKAIEAAIKAYYEDVPYYADTEMRLRAAIAAYEQALWRPVEESPSADVDFLLAHRGWPNDYWEFEVGFYRSSKGGWINARATHYRPLPPPPVMP